MGRIKHIVAIMVALFIFLGIPSIIYSGNIRAVLAKGVDAVSSASLEIPEQPSGEYFVFINTEKHQSTLGEWENFFLEREVDVIFEDIDCIVLTGDSAGYELAERFRARLPENQMTVKMENAVLAASKLDNGIFDIMVASREAAENYGLTETYDDSLVKLIVIKSE